MPSRQDFNYTVEKKHLTVWCPFISFWIHHFRGKWQLRIFLCCSQDSSSCWGEKSVRKWVECMRMWPSNVEWGCVSENPSFLPWESDPLPKWDAWDFPWGQIWAPIGGDDCEKSKQAAAKMWICVSLWRRMAALSNYKSSWDKHRLKFLYAPGPNPGNDICKKTWQRSTLIL